jgi:putative PEP-CTERM system TPR-repeat lipoprotein
MTFFHQRRRNSRRLRVVSLWAPTIVVAAALTACDGPADREEKFMKRAEQHLAERRPDKAMLELRNVLQINPTNVEARFHFGVIEEDRGNFRQAFAAFNQVITQKPNHIGANLHLARFYLIAGDLDEAEKRLKIAVDQAPEHPQGRALQASLLLRRGNVEEAIAMASGALKAEPLNLQAITVLASAYQSQKRYDDALAVMDEAIKRDPKSVALVMLRISVNVAREARSLVENDFARLFELAPAEPAYRIALARIYMTWKLPASAELALRDAVRLAPKDENLKKTLVAFLSTQRHFADAEKSFQELIKGAPTDQIYSYGLASLYLQNELSDKARAIYESIIQSEKDPRRILTARNALARMNLVRGDVAKAKEQIDLVLKTDPKNEDASLMFGRIDFEAKKFDLVIARMRDLIRDHPKAINAYRLLAETYIRTSRLDLAADTLGNGIAQAPKENALKLRLASIYILQERFDAALEILNTLTNTDVAQEAQRLRADVFARSRRFKEAAAAIDELEARGAKPVVINALKGRLFMISNDHAAAAAAFEKALELGSTDPNVVTGLTSALLSLKRFADAEARLAALLQKDSQQSYLHNLAGEVQSRQGHVEKAIPFFRQAIQLEPRWSIPYVNLGNLYLGTGKFDEAIAVLEVAVKQTPESYVVRFGLAFAHHQAGNVAQAIEGYERVLKDNPQSDAAANNLAILLADYGSPSKEALDRALGLVQRFGDSKSPAFLDTLGWVHYRRGEYSDAIRYLQRAIEGAPNALELRYHLGMAYLRNGQPSLAKAELEKSVTDNAKYRGIDEARTTLARLAVETAQ